MRHTHQSFVFVLGKCHCVFVEALEKQLSSLVCLCLSVVVLLSNVFVCALDVVWFVCVVSLVVFVVVSLFVAINRAAPVRNNIKRGIVCALGGEFGSVSHATAQVTAQTTRFGARTQVGPLFAFAWLAGWMIAWLPGCLW